MVCVQPVKVRRHVDLQTLQAVVGEVEYTPARQLRNGLCRAVSRGQQAVYPRRHLVNDIALRDPHESIAVTLADPDAFSDGHQAMP